MASLHGLVAVTGAGVLTPLGDSPDALFAALCEGRSAVKPSAELGGVGLTEIAAGATLVSMAAYLRIAWPELKR